MHGARSAMLGMRVADIDVIPVADHAFVGDLGMPVVLGESILANGRPGVGQQGLHADSLERRRRLRPASSRRVGAMSIVLTREWLTLPLAFKPAGQ